MMQTKPTILISGIATHNGQQLAQRFIEHGGFQVKAVVKTALGKKVDKL